MISVTHAQLADGISMGNIRPGDEYYINDYYSAGLGPVVKGLTTTSVSQWCRMADSGMNIAEGVTAVYLMDNTSYKFAEFDKGVIIQYNDDNGNIFDYDPQRYGIGNYDNTGCTISLQYVSNGEVYLKSSNIYNCANVIVKKSESDDNANTYLSINNSQNITVGEGFTGIIYIADSEDISFGKNNRLNVTITSSSGVTVGDNNITEDASLTIDHCEAVIIGSDNHITDISRIRYGSAITIGDGNSSFQAYNSNTVEINEFCADIYTDNVSNIYIDKSTGVTLETVDNAVLEKCQNITVEDSEKITAYNCANTTLRRANAVNMYDLTYLDTDFSDVDFPAKVIREGGIVNVYNINNTALQYNLNDNGDLIYDPFASVRPAPTDGKVYGMKDGQWVEVTGGLLPPPSDGKLYGMLDGQWTEITGELIIIGGNSLYSGMTVSEAFDILYPQPTPVGWNGLSFTALEDNSTVKYNASSVSSAEYSTDSGDTWTSFGSVAVTLNSGDTIYVRGLISGNQSMNDFARFEMDGTISASGNIMSLYDYTNYTTNTVIAYDYAFLHLFYHCSSLTTAPELPATTLTNNCYTGMFIECTSLATAPALPATTLALGCYGTMFYGCTSLTASPALPATTLAEGCYGYMFYNCSSLTTAPSLPATTLEQSCYYNMFAYCTSLSAAPQLPATTLIYNCYNLMFDSCTSLITAPALPATTLAYSCYEGMFRNCTSLTTAPSLPATTLAQQCYRQMFYGCTSLTASPALSATTLVTLCYYQMFYDCTSLASVTTYATDITAINCTNNWLYNVAANGTFRNLGGATYPSGASGIPTGWTETNN